MDLLDEPTAKYGAVGWRDLPGALGDLTTDECERLLAGPHPVVIVPIGSTEPHGPHLPLATDAILAVEHARRAVRALREKGVGAVAAPPIAYGVTNYAAGFAGAISVSPAVVEALVRDVCVAYREAGFVLVCVVNHHLEPAHLAAIGRGVDAARTAKNGVVFANQLTPRWGRTLSAEFKRGDCHAGSYETSLVLAATRSLVHEDVRTKLKHVPISLADAIRAGKSTFREMGIEHAYTGAPAEATVDEGNDLYAKLTAMVVGEVTEALGLADPRT
jgi:creatinine amidohydrolase